MVYFHQSPLAAARIELAMALAVLQDSEELAAGDIAAVPVAVVLADKQGIFAVLVLVARCHSFALAALVRNELLQV